MALGLCEGVASAGSPGIRVGRGGGEVPSPLRDMGVVVLREVSARSTGAVGRRRAPACPRGAGLPERRRSSFCADMAESIDRLTGLRQHAFWRVFESG